MKSAVGDRKVPVEERVRKKMEAEDRAENGER